MPIRAACPSCSATISAPDSQAGKVVNCPKCTARMALPGGVAGEYEIVDDSPARLPKRAPRIPKNDDDFDDRPRKKKKPAKKEGPAVWLIVTIIALLLAILIAAGVIIWLLLPKPPTTPKKEPVPAVVTPETPKTTWSEFTAPDGSFVAAFPNGPPQVAASPEMQLPSLQGLGGAKSAGDLGIAMGNWQRTDAGNLFAVQFIEMPAIVAKTINPDQGMANMKPGVLPDGTEIVAVEDVPVGGHPGKRIVKKNGNRLLETRIVTVKARTFTVSAGSASDADPAIVKAFFDRFVIKNVPDPKSLPGLDGFTGDINDLMKQFNPPEKK